VALLLDPALTASAKVVWVAQRLNPAAGLAELELQTGLSRPTIRSGLGQLARYKWRLGGPKARIPGSLLAEPEVGAQAKVLYGLLQSLPGAPSLSGRFTYTSLCAQTGLSRNTLKLGIAELVRAGWMQTAQASRLSPIRFTLGSPEWRRSQAEAVAARRRLKRAKFGGEALMQEYLSLLVDSEQFTDHARPGFLVNPITGERLELDRFYPPDAAFEFHGVQHFRATGRFSQAEADAQHLRDLIKAGLCFYQGVHLVVVQAEDLSLQGMIKKIGQCMPLRDLTGHEPLIDLLDEASLIYRASLRTALRD